MYKEIKKSNEECLFSNNKFFKILTTDANKMGLDKLVGLDQEPVFEVFWFDCRKPVT